ncbi:MAG TPA: TIGR00297 family protein [Thermoanaerobaculia bacterium]
MALTRGELARKVVHMGVGLIAFSLRFLGPFWAAILAAGALGFNLFLLPRVGGRKLWRDHEVASGTSIGIILYPLTVLLLILVFWRRLEVAAAAWGILAFGDGMASIAGMSLGTRKLPWNPRKSWAGSLAYVLFGALAAAVLLVWTAPNQGRSYGVGFALAVCFATALLAAALESLPQGLDDNLGVPLVSGLFLLGLVLTQGRWEAFLATPGLPLRIAIAAVANAVLAGLAYAARTVNRSGVVAGFLVGFVIYAFLDWQGYLLLLAFFVLGSAATKLGYRKKAAARLAQEDKGRRGARHALANAGVATACAVFAAVSPYPVLFALAFAGAFATAAADTASSEIGQLLGRRTYLVTTFRPVPRGTEGAVSLEGTLAGILASLVIAAPGAALGLFSWKGVPFVVLAAFVGTTFESVVGAALEKRRLLDNEALNFLNTLVGALVAAAFIRWVV